MATLVELNAALQTINNLAGLQKNMVENANTHITWCDGGVIPANLILGKMLECANEYLRRIGWVEVIIADSTKLTTLTNGLTALGGTVANANASITLLKNAATNLKTSATAGTTTANAKTACQTLLAAVPAPVVVY